jgi:hypothetical protein
MAVQLQEQQKQLRTLHEEVERLQQGQSREADDRR